MTKNDEFPESETERKDSLRTKAEYVSPFPACLSSLPYTAFSASRSLCWNVLLLLLSVHHIIKKKSMMI
ncbi:MAG: hypothetical protein EHM93_19935 [Bacteroidales bacterium]|nr:MAG: hypothetical protein EHM93_19935 [Bacteroidales bacterium]